MPHLRDLQQRHGDAITIVSVSDESPDVIEKFLERESGDTTFKEITAHYRLATDPDGSVKQDYMRAAGQQGIPTAFIVGKTGLIEWIGHPMRMDAPVAGVLSGEWDRDAYARQMREEKEVQARLQAVQQFVQRKQFSEAVKAVDELFADYQSPQIRDRLAAARRTLEQQAITHAKNEALHLQVQTVAVRFQAEEFGGPKTNLVTGGTSYRWFGLSRSNAGNLVVSFNNQRQRHVIPGTVLEAVRWIVVACSVDPSRGQLLVSVDRKKPIAVELGKDFAFEVAQSDSRDRDKNFGFTNYSNGQVFHGLIDEFLFYDRSLSAEEIVKVPLIPEPS